MTIAKTEGHPDYKANGLIPTMYADEFNVEYYHNALIPGITTTKYYEKLLEQGDEIEIPQLPVFSRALYQKGMTTDDIDGAEIQPSVKLTVNRASIFKCDIDKVDQKQSHLQLIDKYKERGVKNEEEGVTEEFFGDIYSKAHALNQGNTAGKKSGNYDLGSVATPLGLTTANVVEFMTSIRAVLAEQNAADRGRMWMVIPEWARHLFVNSPLANADFSGDAKSMVRTGTLGTVDGLTIYTSNQLKGVTAAGENCEYIMAGNMDAISYIDQINECSVVEPSKEFNSLIKGLHVYDWGVKKPEGLVSALAYKVAA